MSPIRLWNAPYLSIDLLGRVRLAAYRTSTARRLSVERVPEEGPLRGVYVRIQHVGIVAVVEFPTFGDRCPAPARTEGGVIQCVVRRDGCTDSDHRRWDRWSWLMGVVWSIKPWWPNKLGRAQDAGLAHTPNIHPCKHCEAQR